ncbi:MAG: 23S rRNA (adenine(2503)-C(2))-methyltransferase RlmN [Acidobacteriota bacterium]
MPSTIVQQGLPIDPPPPASGGRRRRVVGMDAASLAAWMEALGEPPYRGRQIFRWLHARRARSFEEMTDLPAPLRATLAARATLDRPAGTARADSADGSTRWRLAFADGAQVEAVHIPDRDRVTLCVSSQVGCRFACTFCATGMMGLARHLHGTEIVSEIMCVLEKHQVEPGTPFNVVFMGMGEPLDNLDAVLHAFAVLTDPDGFGLSWRRVTVSTVGVISGIRRLAATSPRPRLAISISATDDATRSRLVPANRRWPLAALRQAVLDFPVRPREKVTFEYVLLAGENDTPDDARRLARLARGLPVRVNLIPWNEHPDLPHHRPDTAHVERFRDALRAAGIDVTIRFSRGRDVGAACGQMILSDRPAEWSSPS